MLSRQPMGFRRCLLAGAVAALAGLSGCASLYTQSSDPYLDAKLDCSDAKAIPHLYSGTVFDVYCLPAENVAFFCLVDLPLSLAVDTLISPVTLYRQIQRGHWYDQATCQARRAAEPAQ